MIYLRFLHFFVFIFWYGSLLYFTFVQAPLLFRSLPRETFGLVQSKLFPSYYMAGYLCGSLSVLTFHILHPLRSYQTQDCVKITALSLMLLGSLAQGLWAGPKVAQWRVERARAEEAKDPDSLERVRREFGKAHGISSSLNLLVILCGTLYLVLWFREMNP